MVAVNMLFALWITSYVGVLIHEFGHFIAAKLFTKLSPTDFQVLGWPNLFVKEINPSITISIIAFHGRVCVSGDPDQPPPASGRVNWEDSVGRDRLIFALGGPFLHAVAAMILIFVCFNIKNEPYEYSALKFTWFILGWVQLASAVGNLVPSKISDGGHILRVICHKPINAYMRAFDVVPLWSGRVVVFSLCFFGSMKWPGFTQ